MCVVSLMFCLVLRVCGVCRLFKWQLSFIFLGFYLWVQCGMDYLSVDSLRLSWSFTRPCFLPRGSLFPQLQLLADSWNVWNSDVVGMFWESLIVSASLCRRGQVGRFFPTLHVARILDDKALRVPIVEEVGSDRFFFRSLLFQAALDPCVI